ncbi:TB2/DP1, HVA22 family protein [Toxoplasma gondii TgCatPRC2]|uniref:TB2/DP1, HVA22 domain-containing protein n=15 Tax=Toxoplasma gondii TaxID=5811 RepID=A0A125YSH9_TOXGV|nr:TB2/DP1, HVA22 family protein [Toxoplasma gondii ME49]EPR58288.1 TB2/DP1, HVA22 family protein [Toxoplasma gondii GT1]ESS29609.1 TB2/DP1, HVA22 family protein [Toxoplasma gondii VEG]KAF4645027.1 TB2/DP1, HVA22 family protein [Toxoplasma gondii]KFG30595.1 TB2/DP1, HVA22 family protein [Toxoplasma gondii GAB2-2007-GAL-DOM2]KFG38444.1 TB2/DP1, HVA22 family protein [Toxoplasma gondii FOU]KFG43394.1 TB2/DP1, HVA22 family protein [Toxoplasma gondii p89]KFG57824.1 TB2/DP1, HVA22 family protein [|eukprot:XP_002371296.1 TB2/DP1, HVA22 family protein [Toxoplasma gondii ME49]
MISLLGNFLGSLLVLGVSFVYPAYLTFRFLLAHRAAGDSASRPNFPATEYIQHVFYWVLYAWLSIFIGLVLSKISAFIPLYHELLAALFYWLASPDFKGAGWLWLVVLSPHYSTLDSTIRDMYEIYCPPTLKMYLSHAVDGSANAAEEAFRRDRSASNPVDRETVKNK